VNKFVEIPVKFHLISISELVLVAARIWKWIYVQSFFRTTSLGFVVQSSLCLFLLALLVVDVATFYLEVRSWAFQEGFISISDVSLGSSHTELIKNHSEVMRSHTAFRGEHHVQKSLLNFLLENDLLVGLSPPVEGILQKPRA
jgi:hypothetical protein